MLIPKSSAVLAESGALLSALENPRANFTYVLSRTDIRSRSPRLTASSF